jgi:hypothetical protein
MLRNECVRRRRGSVTGEDGVDMGGSDSIGCCGCRVIMAGERRADTPSIENLLGTGVDAGRYGAAGFERGDPGIKHAG